MRSVFAKMGNAATSKKGDSAENGKERLRNSVVAIVMFADSELAFIRTLLQPAVVVGRE